MNIDFKIMTPSKTHRSAALADLAVGERGVLEEFHMPAHIADHLMNLGFIPGLEVQLTRTGPGGNPCVYRVDGAEVALRRDLSRRIAVRRLKPLEAEAK